MQATSQSVDKLPSSASDHYVQANSPSAAAQTKVVTQYVPVPVPGQLMPIPKNAGQPNNTVLTSEAAVKNANQQALVTPNSQQFFNAMMTYDYMPGAMYTIYAAPLAITDIQFAPGEKIISEAAGDTLRWQVSQTYSGDGASLVQHILIKPSMSGISNTMVVTTNQRVYHLVLVSTNDNTYMVSVQWNYPNDMVQFNQSSDPNAAASTSTASGSPFQLDLANLDFNYQFGMVEGSKPSWYPVRVFNDGRQTFIEFPENFYATDLPVLFIADNNGNYGTMVNWRLKGRYMIVDTVINKARLQTGVKTTGMTIVQIQQTNQDN
jgi:type IV secretion system protein VirB9